jgi:hypothetical protein
MRTPFRLFLVASAASLPFLLVGTAGAEGTVILPLDNDGNVVVEMTQGDDGSVSGSLNAINLSASPALVKVTGSGSITYCVFSSDTLPATASSSLDVKSAHCDLEENGNIVTIAFGGTTSPAVAAILTPKKQTAKVAISSLMPPFVVAAVLAILTMGIVFFRRPKKEKGGESARVSWSDDVDRVPSSWSFKDSWVSNISVFGSVFVAIFGAKDVLKAVLGDDTDVLTARLVITAAISGLFVGVAPLVLKVFGKTDAPTVGGLLVGSAVTLVGVAGQILGVYWVFERQRFTKGLGANLGDIFRNDASLYFVLGLLVFLLYYAGRTSWILLDTSFKPADSPKASDELVIAASILLAGGNSEIHLGNAHQMAQDYLDAVAKAVAAKAAAAPQPPSAPSPITVPRLASMLRHDTLRSGVL